MSTQYCLVQSGKTASGGCSVGQGSSEPVAPRIYYYFYFYHYFFYEAFKYGDDADLELMFGTNPELLCVIL
jgi:hypothetical protein